MKPWSFRKKFVAGLLIIFVALVAYRSYKTYQDDEESRLSRNEILSLEINGVIMNGKKFLHALKKYAKDDTVKAIVIDVNSPGGAVGPSQELYYEILRAKKETKKPIVCVSTGLMASGGYYAALACDKIVVAPGALIGSIGVIMEFANLERLYDWAKIQRYTITSGKFKDSGSEYRPMRDDERALFQEMITEVYDQFRGTVAKARNLPLEAVTQYADGRVMTGAKAVEIKFADAEGTYEDAVKMVARMANLKEGDYKVFKPKREKISFWDIMEFGGEEEDDLNSVAGLKSLIGSKVTSEGVAKELVKTVLKTKYMNQPLFLMPGYWE
ncbi:MAG: signal peptide peptidase [Pseudobdellovibrio sp.]|jgi:protease-4|nr:signal peptide peptidase [Pseudobdellovibrio sp.]